MTDNFVSSYDLGRSQSDTKPAEQSPSYFDLLMKAVIVGNSSVGKTNILNRLVGQKFSHSYVATIGLDFKVKTTNIDGKIVKLQLWDTAGQERFRTLTKTYFQAASIVLVVFSLNDRESYEYTDSWMKQIDESCGSGVRKILVANKSDTQPSQRAITSEEIRQLEAKFNAPCVECSALTGRGLKCLQEAIDKEAKTVLNSLTVSQLNESTKLKRDPRFRQASRKKLCC